MRNIFLIVAFVIATAIPAMAQQQAPQKFVPFTVEEQDARNLRAFLDEQPMKMSLPILQWMEALEQRAINLAKDAEKNKTEVKPETKTEEKPKE